MISSLAVARRITPLRCRFPCSSTNPLGSVNSNSVLNAISKRLLPGCEALLVEILDPGAPRATGGSPGSREPLWRLRRLHLLEHDLEPLRAVARLVRVERRAVP